MARRRATLINRSDRFIADTHFGHHLMLRYRPFDTIDEHDEHIIRNWNRVVGASDTVYHVGDFAFWRMRADRMQSIFDRLHGRKILLEGNHDTDITLGLGWHDVLQGPVHFKDYNGNVVIAQHHPLREWDGWHRGSVHLHGHTHNSLPSGRRSFDVGVDHAGSYPLTWTEIADRMANLPDLDFRGVPVGQFKGDRYDLPIDDDGPRP